MAIRKKVVKKKVKKVEPETSEIPVEVEVEVGLLTDDPVNAPKHIGLPA